MCKKLPSDFAPGPSYRGKTDFWTLKFSEFGTKCHIWRHLAASFINIAGHISLVSYKGTSVSQVCKLEPPSSDQSGVAGRQIIDIMQNSQSLDFENFSLDFAFNISGLPYKHPLIISGAP